MHTALNRAALRHEVADWRDRQIIEASIAINRVAAACRANVQVDFAEVSVANSLFNTDAFAGAKIDERIAEPLQAALADRLMEAAKDLAAIDPSLVEVADTLPGRAADFGAPPSLDTEGEGEEIADVSITSTSVLETADQSLARRITRGATQVMGAAADLANAAASATETVIRDRLALKVRLNAGVTRRIENAYLGDSAESARSRIIRVIDETSEAARLLLA